MENKANWKKRLEQVLWLLAGIGAVVLMGAAMRKKDQKLCTDIRIEIMGTEQQMFIDEKDIAGLLKKNGEVIGEPVAMLNLRYMETLIEKDPWVKNAEMFFDNKQVLDVRIEEREPVARVFTKQGSSFYVDREGLRLPLSEKLSARVPVFTNFPSEKVNLSKPDSALLKNIVSLGRYVLADSFWMAQTAQIDITPEANFELVPVIGNHTVALGNASELDSKFNRLYTFYRQAWLQNGMQTYSHLDVQYHNEVVATRRNYTKPVAKDSLTVTTAPVTHATPAAAPVNVKPVAKKNSTTKSVGAASNKRSNNSLTNERKAKAVMKKQTTTKTHTL
ncbi:cell division protein FtsQ [Hydrobacter penzbergensis]|uniref:Cell division protein FtsQ n=2 Tax=Hydrobacter penzbergensis TaxID=1235997 RepID=A0A8X8IFS2_9BACT|nr:cell division protein FtsQ [Hydrobacter penzbergensis]